MGSHGYVNGVVGHKRSLTVTAYEHLTLEALTRTGLPHAEVPLAPI